MQARDDAERTQWVTALQISIRESPVHPVKYLKLPCIR
jgi:hypothetical protein